MVNIGICDDNIKILNHYKDIIILNTQLYIVNLECFNSGEELIFKCENNINQLDIIIMDIELGKMNGIETMSIMREKGFLGHIIYLTSIKDYVFDSFDSQPLNYILKNKLSEDKFKSTLLFAIDKVNNSVDDTIVISSKQLQIKILKKDILYIESIIRIVKISVVTGENYEVYMKMSQIVSDLDDERFFRVNKSFVINLECIKAIKQSVIIMNDNYEIIGRKYLKALKENFSRMLNQK